MIGQFYHTLITGGLFPHFHAPHTFEYKVLGGKNVIRGNIFKSTSADFGQAVESVGSSIMPGWLASTPVRTKK